MTTSGHPPSRVPEEGSVRHKHSTLAALPDERNRIDMRKTRQSSRTPGRTKSLQLLASCPVLAIRRLRAAALGAALGSLLVLCAAGPGGADSTPLKQHASNLRQENATLSERSQSTLVELYSLESRLRAQQARVDSLRAQVDAVAAEQASVRHQVRLVRRVLTVSQKNLGQRLVRIYETGQPDALAILLGAESLGDAVSNLDFLHALAGQDQSMLRQARRAQASLDRLTRSLTTRESRLSALEEEASAAAGELEAARAERESYLAELASRRRLNDEQIASLEDQARAADRRSTTIAAQQAIAPTPAPATPAPAPTSPPIHGQGRAMTVVATAYALPGTTATGLPVGPGIVAVDPTVIPFGTHMTIPGYGEGVAADTGSAIVGARIDVWVPTEAQASQWGIKTITIYLH
jgi:3D (Asp-Asp-Asp) domain-containing protein